VAFNSDVVYLSLDGWSEIRPPAEGVKRQPVSHSPNGKTQWLTTLFVNFQVSPCPKRPMMGHDLSLTSARNFPGSVSTKPVSAKHREIPFPKVIKGDCHCRSRVLVMELARLRWALVGETPAFDLIHQDYSGDWATRTRETGQPVQTLFSTKRCESVFVGGSRGSNTFRAGGLLRTSRGVRMLRGNLDALVPRWATIGDRCIAQACNCNP